MIAHSNKLKPLMKTGHNMFHPQKKLNQVFGSDLCLVRFCHVSKSETCPTPDQRRKSGRCVSDPAAAALTEDVKEVRVSFLMSCQLRTFTTSPLDSVGDVYPYELMSF